MTLALLLLCAHDAAATTLADAAPTPQQAFLDLAPLAERVLVGRVNELSVQVIDGAFVTLAELDVEVALAGPDEPTVTIHWPGGSDGVLETIVAGAPILQPGDEIVVALDDRDRPVGLARGILLVDPEDEHLVPAPRAAAGPPRARRPPRPARALAHRPVPGTAPRLDRGGRSAPGALPGGPGRPPRPARTLGHRPAAGTADRLARPER